ncbi:CDP-alcohol phosphatidyltransferase family protein [Hyperthermus butylicus]|uniref:CDP-alcohol phosphatidyltransferase n=1 Tax=Hyperthermus butylicus (strain DSM 5456 / JCM 9403 / PLM1-5) TaxID=415426 RepID=A2BMZ8_HYPBU|nr:CDP-alcohol phosphatidyltransferase family protein [Hyperthermus butylicus]ABM81359.1 putative CDP-alcohol phosphatidyltransferase [Hyperthermus butylicus DSM 5456]
MLGKLRRQVAGLFARAAKPLALLPADVYTVLGLAAALAYLAPCSSGKPIAAAVMLAASGLLDALDGAVARLRGEAGPRGAFLDSVLDRITDTVYALGFLLLGYNPLFVLAFLSGALVTSYTRARYESLTGKSMEGIGLLERSDRVAAQALVLIVHGFTGLDIAEKLYAILAAASWATVIQRLAQGIRQLGKK